MMRVFYSDEYAAAGHSFDTTRKARWIADSLGADPIDGIELISPEPVTEAELRAVHSAEYVDAVRTGRPLAMATSQGFDWDSGLWTAVCASNGGTVAAALAALEDGRSGSLSSGLHHARRDEGRGFCTFNGLVLAARAAQAKGASRVLVLDLDAHCGGGTHELIAGEPRILHRDVSVSAFDSYTPDSRNERLEIVTSADRYLRAVGEMLDSVPDDVDLAIYNAGMDPFERCSIGGLSGIDEGVLRNREATVLSWAAEHGIPLAFVLAGGYTSAELDRGALVDLHRMTLTLGVYVALPPQPLTAEDLEKARRAIGS